MFFFQRAQGCFECDISVRYGIKEADISKPCKGCWDFNMYCDKNNILTKANKVEKLIRESDFLDIVSYYIRYFEMMGDLGVDEIVYKYTETPFHHQGWHFYAVGIKNADCK